MTPHKRHTERSSGVEEKPNPGSDAALDQGCTCPVLDNGHGRGDGPFWITGGCPLHDQSHTAPRNGGET